MAVLTIADDEGAVAVEAVERVTTLAERSISERGSVVMSLAGGRTPRRAYELLGDATSPWRGRIDWARVHLFWGDERHVPPDHPESNFGLARDALLRHVPVPLSQVHRIRAELADPAEAAREYESTLRDGFAAAGRADRTFDVMLLGLGADAHIASIFPDSPLLTPHPLPSPSVAAVWVAHLSAWRITLTPAALLDARAIMVVTSGRAKADAVRAALEMPLDVRRWPAHALRAAAERVNWVVDRAAYSSPSTSAPPW